MVNKLKQKLILSVQRNSAEGMLFSGGLDTSILALLSPEAVAINVSLEDYAPDLKFAKILEKFLHLILLKMDYLFSKKERKPRMLLY